MSGIIMVHFVIITIELFLDLVCLEQQQLDWKIKN